MGNHEARPRRRVVVTGLGAITPLGLNVTDHWDGLVNGRSGITRISQWDPTGYPTQIAGEVKGFDPTKFMSFKEARRMARCSQLAVATAKEALDDSGLGDFSAEADRVGVLMGTAIGGFDFALQGIQTIAEKGWARLSPFAIPESLANMPAPVPAFSGSRDPDCCGHEWDPSGLLARPGAGRGAGLDHFAYTYDSDRPEA